MNIEYDVQPMMIWELISWDTFEPAVKTPLEAEADGELPFKTRIGMNLSSCEWQPTKKVVIRFWRTQGSMTGFWYFKVSHVWVHNEYSIARLTIRWIGFGWYSIARMLQTINYVDNSVILSGGSGMLSFDYWLTCSIQ